MKLNRIKLGLPAHVLLWIAALFIGLLVASGTVPIIRAFSPSYAGIPVELAMPVQGADPLASADADTAGAMLSHRARVWCVECGVVESMREWERSADPGDSGNAGLGLARSTSGVTPTPAPSARTTRVAYEFTVRFRDGSAIVFSETTPRTWRPGSRVMVIGRTQHASTDVH